MRILITFVIIFFYSSTKASSINVIRDAEIENLLNDISKILVKGTQLENDVLTFYLDNQKFINALVTPDKKFFFTTELLLKSKNVEDVAGVISHEIGHIIGGHFQKRQKKMKKTSVINILSSILAVGAIKQKPIVKDDVIVPGHVMRLTLSCDHRIVDGVAGAKFLSTLKNMLESPLMMFC